VKGIPVDSKGDPLTPTIVLAESYRHFIMWAQWSLVNPRSHNIIFADRAARISGMPAFDVVFYGPWYEHPNIRQLRDYMAWADDKGLIRRKWNFPEAKDIEPDVRP
jgi:hypothetical protein